MKESINSHLIYGVEWDSVLQWLLDSNATIGAETSGTRTITDNDVQSDSRSWGNYSNATGGAATNAGDAPEPGGTNEYWKVNNIYDLAGNVNEWTQENYSTGNNRVVRGGGYSSDGDDGPATFRYSNSESSTTAYIRVQGWLLCVELYSGSDN